MGHPARPTAGNRDDLVPGCDGPQGDGTDFQARGGAGADGEPNDASPTDATDLEDESDADADVEPSMEAPSPGVPVSPEEYRLKKQAAEMPGDS